jgi:protein TonB
MGTVQSAASALHARWRDPVDTDLLALNPLVRAPLWASRLQRAPRPVLSKREGLLLGVFALVLHGAVIYWINSKPTPQLPVVPPQVPPMTIEFSRPAPPAPPVVEPPPPPVAPAPVVEPPPPPVDELAAKPKPPPKPKPVVKPVVKPVSKPVAKPLPTPEPAPAPAPVAAPAPPAPAPAAPAPVTPPSASAGYLNNPAPEYPSLAMRRGWEGTVMLRVQVLPSGKPGEIQVQKSSGRTQLDDAALAAVKRWTFVPAKQGNVPQAGWVSVPIDFKIQ